MGTASKSFSLVLIVLLAVSSLMMVESVFAQSIPKPSVPEFTVQIMASPYDVPTTHSIDPYTGKDITHQGYHVENRSIEVSIKNQPFNTFNDSGWIVDFYYNVRVKGHYAQNWIELYNPVVNPELYSVGSQFTVFNYPEEYSDTEGMHFDIGTFPAGGQVDFQVEAMTGYVHRGYNPNASDQLGMFPWVFDGETSGWSNTQTVTILETSTSISPSPFQHPTINTGAEPPQTEPFPIVPVAAFSAAVAVLVVAGLLVYHKKHKR
jgi:hypothetical protein